MILFQRLKYRHWRMTWTRVLRVRRMRICHRRRRKLARGRTTTRETASVTETATRDTRVRTKNPIGRKLDRAAENAIVGIENEANRRKAIHRTRTRTGIRIVIEETIETAIGTENETGIANETGEEIATGLGIRHSFYTTIRRGNE